MSREAKWIWKAETPASVPAGARISAGKFGSVARSLPITAVASVKRPPPSCMPSPESPAKRTMTRSRSSIALVISSVMSAPTTHLRIVRGRDGMTRIAARARHAAVAHAARLTATYAPPWTSASPLPPLRTPIAR